MQFFIPMIPPTVTHQDKKIRAFMRGGKPCAVLHDSERLKTVKQKFHAYLAPHRPPQPLTGPVRLVVKWIFPADGHGSGEWKTTKPDTDNMQKALKDTMTRLHYWQDDAQVASEIVEKFWGNPCGIFVQILPPEHYDAEPAKWIECDYKELDHQSLELVQTGERGICCSKCRHVFKMGLLWSANFCPNCGKPMEVAANANQ